MKRKTLVVLMTVLLVFSGQVLAASDAEVLSTLNELDQIADQAKGLANELDEMTFEMMPEEVWFVEVEKFTNWLVSIDKTIKKSEEPLPFTLRRDRHLLRETLKDVQKSIQKDGRADPVLLKYSIEDMERLKKSILKYLGGKEI